MLSTRQVKLIAEQLENLSRESEVTLEGVRLCTPKVEVKEFLFDTLGRLLTIAESLDMNLLLEAKIKSQQGS